MKVNHKQMYLLLRQQVRALQPKAETERANHIPENFNQIGWELTEKKLEELLAKLKELRARKGNRLTPQFYRTIYNRALIGMNEADKLAETLSVEDGSINFEAENIKLMAQIQELQAKQKAPNKTDKSAEKVVKTK